jgi:DNA invertase Pin-like site-specific DNA recombinase
MMGLLDELLSTASLDSLHRLRGGWLVHCARLLVARMRRRVHWGERNAAAKLTEDQVREIRRLMDAGAKASAICARFGISYAQCWAVGKRKSWRHLKGC